MFIFTIFLLLSQIMWVKSMNDSTLYVFAYSWTPGFCKGQVYPGCTEPLPYWKSNFTIHGLWPQYVTSGYPSSCTTEPYNSTIVDEVGLDTMIERWPDVKYDVNNPEYDSFWEHEWTKHGTCSGLSQYEYFTATLGLTNMLLTPELIHDSIGQTVDANMLRNAIAPAQMVSLLCSQQSFVGVYTCWQQTNNQPVKLVECPVDVINEDTCKSSDYIFIPSL